MYLHFEPCHMLDCYINILAPFVDAPTNFNTIGAEPGSNHIRLYSKTKQVHDNVYM